MKSQKYILWFKEISMKDVALVGGKNASLGEMFMKLTRKGLPAGRQGINIPNGFAVTVKAYFYFLKTNNLTKRIKDILKGLDVSDIKNLQEKGKKVRASILEGELPEEIKKEIIRAYKKLGGDVAVRSSATAEDLPTASFAGQQETFLNIVGEENLLTAVKKCFASLFTDRAIVYRQELGFDHLKIGLSVGVQKMVRSDLACSGVMFSCDTETGFSDVVLINASYGLGENVVKGMVEPDQYYVFETTLKQGFKPILEKKLGAKKIKMVYNQDPKRPTRNIAVLQKERQKFALNDEEVLQLARWSILIEEHYQKPMDAEWAKDGKTGELFIVQARPETVKSRENINILENYILDNKKTKKVLLTGLSVGQKIGRGRANRIISAKDINKFKKGEVLVTAMTDPDWLPVMKMASAIVTDLGGRTAHAAIVSRELGIPCVVGTGKATKILKNGQAVTISCAEGEIGKVYDGLLPFQIKKTNISRLKKPKTKIMLNLGEPDRAFGLSFIPNDGIGLAREEFIIANSIKIHPLSLLQKGKGRFFIDKLAEGIGKIAAAFYPRPVIVRFSDFKTNEYRSLIGGELFEPREENPMLGFRGAARYLDKEFQPAFEMECQAIKKCREVFGLKNISVMVPFCRTPEEGRAVVKLIKQFGLEGVEIYVMAEIPSNVILADKFLDIFDGMSIGSNDLTQLILGIDRDNGKIAYIGDERNEAVKHVIKKVIETCKRRNKYVGICGQAPSDFPDFTEFLVEQGIDSISLNPDTVIKTILALTRKQNNNHT